MLWGLMSTAVGASISRFRDHLGRLFAALSRAGYHLIRPNMLISADIAPRTRVVAGQVSPSGRDLRLDLFRGVALLMIFIDHTPQLAAARYTILNFMFFDASEIFIFIAGYTAALVYRPTLQRYGLRGATMRIYRQIYLAQLILFGILLLFYTISPVFTISLDLVQRTLAHDLGGTILRAVLLQAPFWQMSVLPVYVILLAGLPVVLVMFRVAPWLLVSLSAGFYGAALGFRWTPDAAHIVYDWVNVLEWQFLFVVGLAAAHLRASGRARVALSSWLPALAFVAVTLFAVLHMPAVRLSILGAQPIYWLMDKRDLGLLRLLNFLVAAYLVASLLKPDSRMLRWRALAPIVGCGQHSLPIFCLGLMLSALGGYLLLTIDNGAIMQTLVSLGGIATLIGALLLLEKRAPVPFRRKMPLPLSSAPV